MRTEAYGQRGGLTWVDRLGVELSARQIRRQVGSLRGLRVGDFGCGYEASFMRGALGEVARAVLADVALAEDLRRHPRVTALVGQLPATLAGLGDGSLDVALCISLLEHLDAPERLLGELHRVLAPGALCLVNVPSWRGKWFLELSAYRLGLSPPEEVRDHKRYYDPAELEGALRAAGFPRSGLRCFRHKLGLNTFAVCRK